MDRKEIFDQFINALESNNMDLLDGILDRNAKVISSAHGKLEGIEAIKSGLLWKGENLDHVKLRIFNHVTRATEDYAAASCYLLVHLGKMVNDFMNNFLCGFRMTVEYRKEDVWRITEVKASMVYEWGNSLLVANAWTMMDYGKWEGYDPVIIDRKKDAPWDKVPVSTVTQTAEEAAAEAFWHYNWCIDTDDFDTLSTFVTDGVAQKQMGQSKGEDLVNWLKGKREKWVEYQGITVPKEACWSHISTIKSIHAEREDYVTADFYRVEPNRLGNKFLHKYNMGAIVYTAIWHMAFRKIGSEWFLDKWEYENVSLEDCGQWERRYF